MKPFTHTGRIVKCSAAAMGNDYTIKLRETTRWWVSDKGTKYYKTNGWPIHETWAHWKLDIATVSPILVPVSPVM